MAAVADSWKLFFARDACDRHGELQEFAGLNADAPGMTIGSTVWLRFEAKFNVRAMEQAGFWFPSAANKFSRIRPAGLPTFSNDSSFTRGSGTFVANQGSHDRDPARAELDFQSLVDQHYRALFQFGMSLTRSESDAGDLVQETFLIWATKGHQLNDLSKVKSWLFTTLHRQFLETHRHSTRFPHIEMTAADPELPNVEADFVNHLDGPGLLRLLARVDAHYQAAVALYYLEDYSYNEIAGILEVPLGTVKSRIARGLDQLRQLMRQADMPRLQTKEKIV
jgi:RNA polymerase sigma-70 factor (ECF subfamily)